MTNNSEELEPNKVTICVVNYKTELPTKLCMRSLRKHTRHPHRMLVIDNDSGDASLDYLRSLSWIDLIERGGEVIKPGSWAAGTAYDIGLKETNTEFFMVMHSDTFVRCDNWLSDMVKMMRDDPELVCIGTEKLDFKPKWRKVLKSATDIKAWMRKAKQGDDDKQPYARSICSIYRTEILKKENLSFFMKVEEGVTCAKQLYYELLARNYKTLLLEPEVMGEYIYHLTHATGALNSKELSSRKKTEVKFRKKFDEVMQDPAIQNVLDDDSLDK